MIGQGIHDEFPMSQYIADPCPEPSLSKGVVKNLVERSPRHAWLGHPRLGGENWNSARADLGSAAHSLVLGGPPIHYIEAIDKNGVVVDSWRTKGAKEEQAAARENGEIPILEKDRQALGQMAAKATSVLSQFGPGKTEQTMAWQDGKVWCRCRPDWISDDLDVVIDLKTANCADPMSWTRRTLVSGGYDIQAALCLRGLNQILGDDRQRQFLFLVQEIDPPYECSLVGVSPELEHHAYESKIRRALPIWRRCLDRQEWPGYATGIHWADVPSWDRWEHEERNLGGDK